MKGIKNFYKSNRIFVILMLIVVVCVIVMSVALVRYFYGGGNTSVYGSRLDGIEDVKITDSRIEDIQNKYKAEEKINTAKITITGKIIYIKLEFANEFTLVEAQGKATSMLDEFSDEEKAYYDFQFMLKQDKTDKEKGFTISGAKNVNGTNVVWNNNIEPEEEETTTEQKK